MQLTDMLDEDPWGITHKALAAFKQPPLDTWLHKRFQELVTQWTVLKAATPPTSAAAAALQAPLEQLVSAHTRLDPAAVRGRPGDKQLLVATLLWVSLFRYEAYGDEEEIEEADQWLTWAVMQLARWLAAGLAVEVLTSNLPEQAIDLTAAGTVASKGAASGPTATSGTALLSWLVYFADFTPPACCRAVLAAIAAAAACKPWGAAEQPPLPLLAVVAEVVPKLLGDSLDMRPDAGVPGDDGAQAAALVATSAAMTALQVGSLAKAAVGTAVTILSAANTTCVTHAWGAVPKRKVHTCMHKFEGLK